MLVIITVTHATIKDSYLGAHASFEADLEHMTPFLEFL
jgi:hypothetical protein